MVQHLLRLTHRQWLYRNSLVHFKGSDGYTRAEDRGLLDEDFDELGSSPAAGMYVDRSYAMETAISAAEHSRRSDTDKLRRRLTHGPHFFTPKAVAVVPVKDSEGSIKY